MITAGHRKMVEKIRYEKLATCSQGNYLRSVQLKKCVCVCICCRDEDGRRFGVGERQKKIQPTMQVMILVS